MESLNVIKVGGAIVEDDAALQNLLLRFAALPGLKVLVHGGGRSATRMATQLGIESRMEGGRRITDEETLRIVTMVYGGLVNKNLVARLQACGINALGLTGADAGIILSHRRPPKEILSSEGTSRTVDFGFVGDVDRVDDQVLASFLEQGIVPVIAPLTHDGKGNMLNTNADTMASEVACALSRRFRVTLTYCFELPGVLRNPEDPESLIPRISEEEFHLLKAQGIVSGGMIPKLENAFEAIRRGVEKVVITKADYMDGSLGTHLVQTV